MKFIYLILTLTVQFVVVVLMKLLDNFAEIVQIFFACLALGALLRFMVNNDKVKTLGWGVFFGSLISLSLLFVFMMLISGKIT